MKHIVKIKNLVESMPYSIGKYLVKLPFQYRLGKEYLHSSMEIISFEKMSHQSKQAYIIKKLNHIVEHAKKYIPFYEDLYKKYGVIDLQIKSFDDFKKLPIITKEMIRNHIDSFNGALQINTGGTSGEPLKLFVDKHAFAREWAHMHFIWGLKDYRYTDPKFTLRGKNLGSRTIIFNPVHNEFIINTYLPTSTVKKDFLRRLHLNPNFYIHGYPSTIYQFFKELEAVITEEEKQLILSKIKVALFGSEYPLPYMVKYLSDTWGLDHLSWYGHSEMAILAYDYEKNNCYKPLFTYGYAETVDNRLIGTSYNNFDMPLIRYDTGDKVEGVENEYGFLDHFSITAGREGDFIKDKNGHMVSLTALIFGRHHRVFDFADFVQIQETAPGKATLLVTKKKNENIRHFEEEIDTLFDLKNVDIDFQYKVVDRPIRTKAGKLKLKI